VLANILAGPLIELALLLLSSLCSGGRLVLSGILAEQADEVIAAYCQEIPDIKTDNDDGWVRLQGRKI